MKKILIQTLFSFLAFISYSQVPKKIIVEHFTNSKCSACASRNPGFYSNYNSQTGVIHLAIHPSSPYNTCVFNTHNPSQNDSRTNYYGIFGGTPRLVIQGAVIPGGADYGSSAIFSPHLSQTSPVSIKIIQSKYDNDSIRARVVIKTEDSHTLNNLSLFVALAEDTINYTGSNGEPVHYDVFRKALTSPTGLNITIPSTIGDSVVYTMSSTTNAAWNFSRLFTLVILQETSSKAVVQTESVPANSNNILSGISHLSLAKLNINTYVINKSVVIEQEKFTENVSLVIYDLIGKKLLEKTLTNNKETINLLNISTGMYMYSIKFNDAIIKTGKIIIP